MLLQQIKAFRSLKIFVISLFLDGNAATKYQHGLADILLKFIFDI